LESVDVDPANPHFIVENGCLIHKQQRTLIRVLRPDSQILIPAGISIIGPRALSTSLGVISIDFCDESSVVTIAKAACIGLRSLKFIRIPATVRKIHPSALLNLPLAAFDIDKADPCFSLHEDCLIERATNRLIHSFSGQPKLLVPSAIQIIGKYSLWYSDLPLYTLDFPEDSQLLKIEKMAFASSALVSLTLPAGVEFIDGSAFEGTSIINLEIAPGNRHFVMQDRFLVGVPEQRLIRYFGVEEDVIVPDSIAILGRSCFSRCSHLTSISLSNRSELKEIDHRALMGVDLPFRIPASVEKINGSAFAGSTTRAITVDERNGHFRIDREFLVGLDGRQLIRYLGHSSRVSIDERIETIGQGCFYGIRFLRYCDFGAQSQVQAIMEEAFWGCSVLDMDLPPTIRYIGRKALMCTCHASIVNQGNNNEARFRKWQNELGENPLAVFDVRMDALN
jgi:hypothetical protein